MTRPDPAQPGPIMTILGLWRAQFGYLAFGALLALAALAAGIALMANSGHVIAATIAGGVLAIPIALQATGAARVILRYCERIAAHDAMFRALSRIRIWFFLGISKTAAGGLGFRKAGDVLARLVNDVEALDGLYLRIIVPGLGALLLLPILAMFLWRESIAALILILPIFAFNGFILPRRAARLATGNAAQTGIAMSGLRSAVLDALTGLREVKIFAAEGRMLARIQSQEAAYLATQRHFARQSSRLNTMSFIAAQAAILGAILLALVMPGSSPLAAVIAVFVLTAAFEATSGLPRAGILFGQARAAAARVVEAATAAPLVPDPANPAPLPNSNAVAFEHISFRYGETLPYVFENLSLQLPSNTHTAVLGPSGAGKSTIAALALKLVAPNSGRIRLGPTDIAALPAEALRSRIAYLSQATHLFADTIRNNLRLGDPDADDARLWEALAAAQLTETIHALPDGLNTWLGESGNTLSGGQGRRLALARTLLSPAPILILDEPCAGLDAATEIEFLKTLNAATKNRTILLIVHRLTGVEQLDRIWRLANGTLMAATG
jgi:ATP-binding cassette subfamily C protein CydC